MRFDPDIYEKVFPRKPETQPIESSVDTFKPTEEKIKGMDHNPGDDTKDPEPKTPEDNPGATPAEPGAPAEPGTTPAEPGKGE